MSYQVLIVNLLPHTSHLSQPCDLGPSAHLKSYYSKNLKSFIALGDTQESLTAQYILAGWRWSGLYRADSGGSLLAVTCREGHTALWCKVEPHMPTFPIVNCSSWHIIVD